VRDELKEGDQVLVKVLAVEGNRIRLSRKAILKEQRAKMGGGEAGVVSAPALAPSGDGEPAPSGGTVVIEGGGDFPDEAEGEPNFNRDPNREAVPQAGGARPHGGDRGGDRGGRGGRPGGGGGGRGRGRGRGGDRGGRGGHGGGGGGRH